MIMPLDDPWLPEGDTLSSGSAPRALILVALLAAAGFSALAVLPTPSAALTVRAPILIDGNAGFTAANGVVGGSGTLADPYIIEGWEIDTRSADGIEVRNTNAYFVVRDSLFYSTRTDYWGTNGIRLTNVTNARAENITARDNALAIIVSKSSFVEIASNNLSSNRGGGIWVGESTNLTLTGNRIASNGGDGLLIALSMNLTVQGNLFTSNSITFWGDLPHYTSHTITPDNLVNGNPVVYRKDCSDVSLDGVPIGELIVANCTNVRGSNFQIDGTDVGIVLAYVNGATFSSVNVSHAYDGILAEYSNNVSVSDSSFASNRFAGIHVVYTTNVSVNRSSFFGGSRGVVAESSERLVVHGSAFSGGYVGIGFAWARDVRISGNDIRGTGSRGVDLVAAVNATVEDNLIQDGDAAGLYASASRNLTISNNSISRTTWILNGPGAGIYLSGVGGVRIVANQLFENRLGMLLHTSQDAIVTRNTVADGLAGVILYRTNATVTENTFALNRTGLDLQQTNGTVVTNNTFLGGAALLSSSTNATVAGNLFTASGLVILQNPWVRGANPRPYFATHTITTDNLVNGKPLLYYKDCAGLDINGTSLGQLIVAGCTGIRVANLRINATAVGIELAVVDGAVVASNEVTDSLYGILVHSSANATLADNRIRDTWDGIVLESSSNVSVDDSEVLYGGGSGILVAIFSSDIAIVGNTVANHSDGIRVVLSTLVSVHHNNLIDNTFQATDLWGTDNAWDDGYPSGGNYWSNYTGVDNCSGPGQDVCPGADGIGDTPFVLDADSQDRYPLMSPYRANNTPPIAAFVSSPSTGDTTTLFTVDASPSQDAEDPSAAIVVRWDWEGDGTWDTTWSTTKEAQHRYSAPGTYAITLEVRDTGRLTDRTTRPVTVVMANTPPVATFTMTPTRGTIATAFSVDASDSSDAEDPAAALEVRWDWEDDGTWDTTWSTAKRGEQSYATPGAYSIRLQVRDTGGLLAEAVRMVAVENTAPEAALAISPSRGTTETSFTVDASGSRDLEDPASSLEVRWDWEGDGVWDTAWTPEKTAQHAYASPGTYAIRLEVRDTPGLTSQAEVSVAVDAPAVSPPAGLDPLWLLLVGLPPAALTIALAYRWKRRTAKRPSEGPEDPEAVGRPRP